MDPIRVSLVFDTQGRPQLQRAAANLGAISDQLDTLARSSLNSARVLRILESDLNRFAQGLHRTATASLTVFNTAFEKTFSMFSQFSRISFYGAVGQVAALSYGLKGLAREFIDINEEFGGIEITLKSMFGSMRSARAVREELARITITSPLPLKDLGDASRAIGAMPALSPAFARQINENRLSDPNGFLRRTIGLLEKMQAFRPDKTTADAVFALREALSGELRSLVRRFEFPAALLVQASGRPMDFLKTRPEAMLNAMNLAFDRLISDQAVQELVRQPRNLWGNIIEQAIQIPLLSLGRAGEDTPEKGLYKRIIDLGVAALNRFGEFGNVGGKGTSMRAMDLSRQLTILFDNLISRFDRFYERFLSFFGASTLEVPGGGKIERSYFLIQKTAELLVGNFDYILGRVKSIGSALMPIVSGFLTILNAMGRVLNFAFETGGALVGFGTLVALKSLPQVLGGILSSVREQFVQSAQAVRSAILTMSLATSMLPLAVTTGAGGAGLANALSNVRPGTYNAAIGSNPFLYNERLLSQAGFTRNAAGRLVHARQKMDAEGFFGNTYDARARSFASFDQLPSGLMFNRGQSPADILARRGMVYDEATRKYVWAPGSGHPAGRVVPQNLAPRMSDLLSGLSTIGMPDQFRQLPTGQYQQRHGRGWRFVSPDVVRSAIQANPQAGMTMGQTYDWMRTQLRDSGAGITGSRVGAGVTAGLVGLGASRGVAGGFGVWAGASAAALTSAVVPVLVAVAGTAAVLYLFDRLADYADKRATKRVEDSLAERSLDDASRQKLQQRVMGEAGFARSMTDLIRLIESDDSLDAYRPGARAAQTTTVTGQLARMLSLRTSETFDLGAESFTRSLAVTPITAEREMTMDELATQRTRLLQDLEALVTAEREARGRDKAFPEEGIRLRSFRGFVTSSETVGPAGLTESTAEMRQPIVRNLDEARSIAETLRSMLRDTEVSVGTLMERQASLLTSPTGAPLVRTGAALDESALKRIDEWKEILNGLNSLAGVIDATPGLEKVRAAMKSFDLSPDTRQLVESFDSAAEAFKSAYTPLKNEVDIFDRELVRIKNLAGIRPELAKFANEGASKAITTQEGVIDKILKDYAALTGRTETDSEGRQQVVIPFKRLDDEGNAITELMPFDEFANKVRSGLKPMMESTKKMLNDQLESSIIEVPATKLRALGLSIPSMLRELTSADQTTTDRVVGQIKASGAQLIRLIEGSTNEVLLRNVDLFKGAFDQLDQLPPMEDAVLPLERELREMERLKMFQKLAVNLRNIGTSIRGALPADLAQEFDTATDALTNGVTEFTSKLSSAADAMRQSINSLRAEQMTAAFNELMTGQLRTDTLSGMRDLPDALAFAQRRFGITGIDEAALGFTSLPPDEERRQGPTRQRSMGYEMFLNQTWIPKLQEKLEELNAAVQQLPEDTSPHVRQALRVRQADIENELQQYQRRADELGIENRVGIRSDRMKGLNDALEAVRQMTDPALGFKLSRRGSLNPQTQWQTGRFGEADNRVNTLTKRFNEFNEASDLGIELRDDFQRALMIDTRGFRAVTGEVERLTAFQNQYMAISQKLSGMSNVAVYAEERDRLRELSEAWARLADEAERTREALTGRGGVLNSMAEGFGGVVSQWNATAANWTEVGATAAQTLSSSFSDALLQIAIHSQDAGEAFRQFGFVVAETMARMATNKFVETLLGQAFTGFGGLFGGTTPAVGGTVTGVTGNTVSSTISVPSMSLGMNEGGLVPGGYSNKDTVPAMLAKGEFVIPSNVVRMLGPDYFEQYRKGQIKGYSTGGLVGGSLPVNTFRSSGGPVGVNAPVNVTVNINGGEAAAATETSGEETDERARLLARSLQNTVRDQLMREQRQGGALYQMMRSTRK